MRIIKNLYEKITAKKAPYYLSYPIATVVTKPIRKYFTNVVAANCPFNCVRILIYKLCGFKIGKHCFIGMRCYLDDMCYKQIVIGNNVTISYGVYFACHGKNQKHLPIIIEDNVYIGMRASIISKNKKEDVGITIGEKAIIGSNTLVNKSVPPKATAIGVPCRIIPEKIEQKTPVC